MSCCFVWAQLHFVCAIAIWDPLRSLCALYYLEHAKKCWQVAIHICDSLFMYVTVNFTSHCSNCSNFELANNQDVWERHLWWKVCETKYGEIITFLDRWNCPYQRCASKQISCNKFTHVLHCSWDREPFVHVFLIDWFERSCVRNDRSSGCGTLKWVGSKNYGGWVVGAAHTQCGLQEGCWL